MDPVGLTVLMRELAADRAVLAGAADNAARWLEQSAPGGLEACAYEMNRLYTVLGRMLERICGAFENHFEKTGNYHEKLLQRLTLDLPGLRPAFLPSHAVPELIELRRFRHVMRHAYDLTLRADRLLELVSFAKRTKEALPGWCDAFEKAVRREQGWPTSPETPS